MKIKKILSITLSVLLLTVFVSGCENNKDNNKNEIVNTESPSIEATEEPSAEPSSTPEAGKTSTLAESITPVPSEPTAPPLSEADEKAMIQNTLDSIQELINDELYDDAQMIIDGLLTQDLTEAQRKAIGELEKQLP